MGILVLLIMLVIIIGLIILINRHDNKYWESQGTTWEKDCTFLGIEDVESFDPEKLASKDQELIDTSLELLRSIIDTKPFSRDYITIDKGQMEHLNPDGCKFINAFFVVQNENKAVITFRFAGEKMKIEDAMDRCQKSYKTYPYDKIFLEKKGTNWVVNDVFRQA